MKGKLVILRHGQTTYNLDEKITGQLDIPLTDAGIEQAKEAGRLLTDILFDAVYSSTLSRAFNTAAIVSEHSKQNKDLKIIQVRDIIDTDSGDFTGHDRNDPLVREFRKANGQAGPNGEKFADVIARVQDFYDTELLPRLSRGENVLVVCHSAIVRVFEKILDIGKIDGAKLSAEDVPNASPEVIEYQDGRPISFTRLVNRGGLAA